MVLLRGTPVGAGLPDLRRKETVMCQTLPGRWSVPLLLLLTAGCASSSLQLLHEPPPYVSDLRSEYFTSNPDSPYRAQVTRGTVVTGMGPFEVLASWGHPETRVRNSTDQEKWTYLDVDTDSGDVLVYDLMFQNNVLTRWSSRPVKDTALAYRSKTEELSRVVPPAEPPSGKHVPSN
jgi:hypothetical protein